MLFTCGARYRVADEMARRQGPIGETEAMRALQFGNSIAGLHTDVLITVAEEYPKDNSGRALIEVAIEGFQRTLLRAPLGQRHDALVWLDGLDVTHPAAPFRPVFETVVRPGVEAELADKQRQDAANKEKTVAAIARIAAKHNAKSAACGLICPEQPEWHCNRVAGHAGRHESAEGGDWHD